MKAAVTTEDHGFEVVELPDPAPAADQVVIRVAACGVCGSDIKAQPFAPAGMVMGHELGGEVVAVGSAGRRMAARHQYRCAACQSRVDRVGTARPVGGALRSASYIGMGPAGGFAEFAAVPARHAFAVPAELPMVFSALVEPFAVGLHGVHSAEIDPGDEVLIVGAGGVGLTTLMWAVQKGAGRVTVADPDPQRRRVGHCDGGHGCVRVRGRADPGAYDAVIECVGRPELIQACQPALRPRGRLVISGACAEPTAIEPITALLKETHHPLLRRIHDRRVPRGVPRSATVTSTRRDSRSHIRALPHSGRFRGRATRRGRGQGLGDAIGQP